MRAQPRSEPPRAAPTRHPKRLTPLRPDARPMPQLARAIAENIQAALACLDASVDGVHDSRSHLRSARAHLRLARGCGDGAAVRALGRHLRTASHRLSHLRDGDVLRERLAAWRLAGAHARAARATASASARQNTVDRVRAALTRAATTSDKLRLTGRWRTLVQGCARTMRAGLHAWKRSSTHARGRAEDADLHRLRRRAAMCATSLCCSRRSIPSCCKDGPEILASVERPARRLARRSRHAGGAPA